MTRQRDATGISRRSRDEVTSQANKRLYSHIRRSSLTLHVSCTPSHETKTVNTHSKATAGQKSNPTLIAETAHARRSSVLATLRPLAVPDSSLVLHIAWRLTHPAPFYLYVRRFPLHQAQPTSLSGTSILHTLAYLHVVHAARSHQPVVAVITVHLVAHAAEQAIAVALYRNHPQAAAAQSAPVVLVPVKAHQWTDGRCRKKSTAGTQLQVPYVSDA